MLRKKLQIHVQDKGAYPGGVSAFATTRLLCALFFQKKELISGKRNGTSAKPLLPQQKRSTATPSAIFAFLAASPTTLSI